MDSQEQVTLLRLVRVALQRNDYPTAISSLEQVIYLAKSRHDLNAEARHRGNLALIYYRAGHLTEALNEFENALECARQDNDHATENGLLGNMGNILREMGRYEDAIHYLNGALLLANELGDQRGRGIWLSNLGLVYDDLDQHAQAAEYHLEAVEIARGLVDQPNLATRLTNLGVSLSALDEFDSALESFDEAITILELLGKDSEIAERLALMGDSYVRRARTLNDTNSAVDDYTQALNCYQRAREITSQYGQRHKQADLLRRSGDVLLNLNQVAEAVRSWQTAYQLFWALNERDEAATLTQRIQQYSSTPSNP